MVHNSFYISLENKFIALDKGIDYLKKMDQQFTFLSCTSQVLLEYENRTQKKTCSLMSYKFYDMIFPQKNNINV